MAPDIPVIPAPAATVVLLRGGKGKREVFLTRRPESMSFLGGFYVFPGGRVADVDLSSRGEGGVLGLDKGDLSVIGGDGHVPFGFYTAGIRELFEESGVLLLCDKNRNLVSEDIYLKMREKTETSSEEFLTVLRDRDLLYAADRLKFLQLFITPELSPQRFYTVFFWAVIPEGQHAGVDSIEVSNYLWISPEEALTKYRKGEFRMIPPTAIALEAAISL